VQWASGACLFVRSVDFWDVGALDERFFAHQEEIDLCWRIKNKGQKIVASGESEVLHVGGATLDTADAKKTFYNFRNTLYNIIKNVQGIKSIIIIFLRLLLDGIAGIKFLLEGKPKHTIAIIKAHFSFYYHLINFIRSNNKVINKKKYYNIGSILWSYFILHKQNFKDL